MKSQVHSITFYITGTGWVASWGIRDEPGSSARNHRLMEVDNPIITLEECNKFIHETGKTRVTVTDLAMCIRDEPGKGVCWFDWGAALLLIMNESYMVQVGIFSVRPIYQERCGSAHGNVAVFTRVSRYLGWIHRRISGCGNHHFITEIKDY